MAEKTINTRQKQKYDTSSNWTANNPTLLAGEIGIESDTNKFKVGNGTSTWNELDYAGGSEVTLYSTIGQNTDGAMTQKAVSDALPQAVTVTLTESQNFNNIVITNEQFELLLSNPENYLIVEMSIGSLAVSLKYRRSQYFTMTSGNVLQEALIFNCVNSASFAPYAERINSLTIIRQTQNGEPIIAVQDDTLDFTTFVPKTRTINEKSLANNITLTATDVNALPDTTFVSTINVNGQPQSVVNFDSDPQIQIDNKFDKTGGNITGDVNLQSNSDISLQFIDTSGTVDSRIRNASSSQALVFNSNAYYFRARTNAASGLRIHPTYMRPETDYDIGTTSNPFTNGYFDNLILGGNDLQETLNNKTTVNINNVPQSTINFDSDPQTQLDNMVTLNTEQTITAPKNTQLSINWTDNINRSIALNKEIIVDNTNDHEITEKTTRHYEWNGSGATGHVTWTDTQGSTQYKKEVSLVSNTSSHQYLYQTITQYGGFNLRSYYDNSTGSGTRYARFEFNSNSILLGYRNGNNNHNIQIDNHGINISSPDNNGLSINGAPIIESGSNANGYYTKFADGTLICYGNKTISNYAMTINYPAIFIDTNYSLVTQFVRDESLGNSSNTQGLNALTTTSCVCYSAYSATATVLWIAIGRWK